MVPKAASIWKLPETLQGKDCTCIFPPESPFPIKTARWIHICYSFWTYPVVLNRLITFLFTSTNLIAIPEEQRIQHLPQVITICSRVPCPSKRRWIVLTIGKKIICVNWAWKKQHTSRPNSQLLKIARPDIWRCEQANHTVIAPNLTRKNKSVLYNRVTSNSSRREQDRVSSRLSEASSSNELQFNWLMNILLIGN